MQDAQPPEEVQGAFEDAIRAREDKQRLINEAEAYSNEIIPKARGASARLLQEAEAYHMEKVAKARGETERFNQLLVDYEKSPVSGQGAASKTAADSQPAAETAEDRSAGRKPATANDLRPSRSKP